MCVCVSLSAVHLSVTLSILVYFTSPTVSHVYLLSCSIVCPIQAFGILIWYIVYEIVENDDEKWYKFTRGSLLMVLSQVSSFKICKGLRLYCMYLLVGF